MDNQWPEPWREVTAEEAAMLEAELSQELSPGHILNGLNVAAIARRTDNDDVLFTVKDQDGGVAEVHLTWHVESCSDWPATTVFENVEDWFRLIPQD